MKSWIKRVLIYKGIWLFSMIIVFSTSFEGERIETREELASAFPIKTGFPLRFAELKYPEIDIHHFHGTIMGAVAITK
ncbi:hypothetical protein [Pontibacillus sp. HMF3514]|uniref:hypothetical protein n=1 Tax=Pontibacillus sp. HMF3514 TaxID=2692425 RepID=UPI001320064E|nr:hypothetical protein [Pontibacillus sp. HMF3514]QHE53353.1 hypothetical protein GS400_15600 [Pontibacillus sp. HMF3514]